MSPKAKLCTTAVLLPVVAVTIERVVFGPPLDWRLGVALMVGLVAFSLPHLGLSRAGFRWLAIAVSLAALAIYARVLPTYGWPDDLFGWSLVSVLYAGPIGLLLFSAFGKFFRQPGPFWS